jgi:hypothetical protein
VHGMLRRGRGRRYSFSVPSPLSLPPRPFSLLLPPPSPLPHVAGRLHPIAVSRGGGGVGYARALTMADDGGRGGWALKLTAFASNAGNEKSPQ